MPPTNLKIWTRRMSWAHKMSWSIISFDLNLDGKVDSVGYFEMQDSLQFCVPIFENCEFYGKWHLQQGGTHFSSSLREEVYNLNAGWSPRVQLVKIIIRDVVPMKKSNVAQSVIQLTWKDIKISRSMLYIWDKFSSIVPVEHSQFHYLTRVWDPHPTN